MYHDSTKKLANPHVSSTRWSQHVPGVRSEEAAERRRMKRGRAKACSLREGLPGWRTTCAAARRRPGGADARRQPQGGGGAVGHTNAALLGVAQEAAANSGMAARLAAAAGAAAAHRRLHRRRAPARRCQPGCAPTSTAPHVPRLAVILTLCAPRAWLRALAVYALSRSQRDQRSRT